MLAHFSAGHRAWCRKVRGERVVVCNETLLWETGSQDHCPGSVVNVRVTLGKALALSGLQTPR